MALILHLVRHFFPLLPKACDFCMSSSATNKAAYIGTTVALLALPAALLSAFILWLIRRTR